MGHDINLLWGTYTWILLHWMSVQIKDDEFINERTTLLKFVNDICGNLPCPSCRDHAQIYLRSVPLKNIETKKDFIGYIYHFHNSVNLRGSKDFQPYHIIKKYKTVNFPMLQEAWNTHFVYGNHIQRNDFMAKGRMASLKREINDYFANNSHKFLMS